VHMSEVVASIESAAPESAGTITFADQELPFPAEVDHASLREVVAEPPETPLDEGIRETIGRFRDLIAAGALSVEDPASA
jgi:hypothetical protein